MKNCFDKENRGKVGKRKRRAKNALRAICGRNLLIKKKTTFRDKTSSSAPQVPLLSQNFPTHSDTRPLSRDFTDSVEVPRFIRTDKFFFVGSNKSVCLDSVEASIYSNYRLKFAIKINVLAYKNS